MSDSATPIPIPLSVAICLYQDVTTLDYQGPADMLQGVDQCVRLGATLPKAPKYTYNIEYLSKNLEPVQPLNAGPKLLPSGTYAEASQTGKQYDIIVIPAGNIGPVHEVEAVAFISEQAPRVKYIISVCAGSSILAATGLLDGRRATTNKALFNMISAMHPNVNWVKRARWIVDGNLWTASGVTAGFDAAYAFLTLLEGPEIAHIVASGLEYRPRTDSEDDEFAAIHGLV